MKSTKLLFLIVGLLTCSILIFQSGCKKDEQQQEEEEDPGTVISEDSKVISPESWQGSFVSMDSSNQTLYFNSNINGDNLKVGDIIVSTEGEGLLRRINSIHTENGIIIIETGDADLEDLIENGELEFEKELTLDDIKSIEYHQEGIAFNPDQVKQAEDIDFSWTINTILFDGDNNHQTTGDQIRLEGGFSCNWGLVISIKYKLFKGLQKVKCGFQSSESLDIELIADLEYNYTKDVNLFTITFNTIVVWIGSIPIVFTPVLKIKAGIGGYAQSDITTSFAQSLSFDAGVQYLKGSGWSTYKNFNKSFDFDPPELTFSAGAEAYLKPELTIKIYGIIGPYVDLKLFSRLDADLFATPWWTLNGGLDLGAGAKAKVFGKVIFDKHFPGLIYYEQLIAQASDPPPQLPVVTTSGITDITEISATCGGVVTGEGNSAVTARGVCWGTTQNPSVSGAHTLDGAGTGSFTSYITGLDTNTTYYVRAYATNSFGTSYGAQIDFLTSGGIIPGEPCPGVPTVSYGGQVYNTVLIGDQCWMKENLNIGSMINGINPQSNNGVIEKYCYNDDPAKCALYGGLYQWDEVMQYTMMQGVQGICPAGWHIPTDDEWKTLEGNADIEYYVGHPIWDNMGWRGYDVGKNLKAASGWGTPGNGTNIHGFTGLPGGSMGMGGSFGNLYTNGGWWTSTLFSSMGAWQRSFSKDSDQSGHLEETVTNALSVRCLQD
ncbi:MAG: hypothetical protein JXA03_05170 [Bacteroidales bacterium]|nr:hypothetical protein [Bacteroidales bacterium]